MRPCSGVLPRFSSNRLLGRNRHRIMCTHRLYIYNTCGHSVFSRTPIIQCLEACIPPDGSFSTTCDLVAHPFQSWRINKLCPACDWTRRELLSQVESSQTITYDQSKWKVSYGKPTHGGLDFWGRRMAEKEKAERDRERQEREARKKAARFSWRRKRKAQAEGEDDTSSVGNASSGKPKVVR